MRWLFLILLCSLVWMTCVSLSYERTFKLKRDKKPSNKSGHVKAFIKKALKMSHIPTLPPIPTIAPRKIILNKQNSELDACKVVNLCSNGGQCITEGSEYYCDCTPQYYGKTCQFYADPSFCQNHKCQNNGTCYSIKEPEIVPNPLLFEAENVTELTVNVQYQCWCKRGFYGTFCEFSEDMQHCAEEGCSGHGFVGRHQGNFECKCQCEQHYSGDRCERVSPCRDLKCTNLGTCIETADGTAKCVCPETRYYKYGQVEVKGDHCEIIDIDETHPFCNPCDGNFNEWRHCLEVKGEITGDELSILWKPCEADDPDCYNKLRNVDCLNNGTCTGVLDKFDIDRFKNDYFLMPKCYCNDGFEGEFCQRQIPNPCDESANNGTFRCLNNGTCEFSESAGARCFCKHGYKGARCEIKDPCQPSPCGEALCVEIPDGTDEPNHACICRLDQDVDPKSLSCYTPHYEVCTNSTGRSTCLNGGHCYPCAMDEDPQLSLCTEDETQRGYRCICAPGFSPPLCDHRVDACSFHQCLNGAGCIPNEKSLANYQCQCKNGYNGTFCQVSPGICETLGSASCVHGKCIENSNSGRGFSCQCFPNFYGFNCHLEEDWNLWHEIEKQFWWTYPLLASLILIPSILGVLWFKHWCDSKTASETDVEASKDGEVKSVTAATMANMTATQAQRAASSVNPLNPAPVTASKESNDENKGKEMNENAAKQSTELNKTKNDVSIENKKEVLQTPKKHKLRKK